jgi:hypothetical protein
MKDRFKLIDYKGKEIYSVDYTNLSTEEEFLEAIRVADEFRDELAKMGKKDLPMLVDMSNSYMVGKVMSELKRSAKEVRPYISKTATVGITGTKKVIVRLVNSFSKLEAKVFDDLEKAKEWLSSEK